MRQIRQILDIRDSGGPPCEHVGDLINQRLIEIEQRITELEQTRNRLHELADRTAELDPAECDGYCSIIQAHITSATNGGAREDYAYALLRTITSYALGYALAYVGWGLGCEGCVPNVTDLLRPDTPDDLARAAEIFCGQADPDAQFEMALDLMLRCDAT